MKEGDRIYCFRTCTREKRWSDGEFTYLKGYWYKVYSVTDIWVDVKAWTGVVRFYKKQYKNKKSMYLSNYFYTDIKQFRAAKLNKINANQD